MVVLQPAEGKACRHGIITAGVSGWALLLVAALAPWSGRWEPTYAWIVALSVWPYLFLGCFCLLRTLVSGRREGGGDRPFLLRSFGFLLATLSFVLFLPAAVLTAAATVPQLVPPSSLANAVRFSSASAPPALNATFADEGVLYEVRNGGVKKTRVVEGSVKKRLRWEVLLARREHILLLSDNDSLSGGSELWTFNRKTKRTRLVARDIRFAGKDGEGVYSYNPRTRELLHWSSDGTFLDTTMLGLNAWDLAVASNGYDLVAAVPDSPVQTSIWFLNQRSGQRMRWFATPQLPVLSWSPDGKTLCFGLLSRDANSVNAILALPPKSAENATGIRKGSAEAALLLSRGQRSLVPEIHWSPNGTVVAGQDPGRSSSVSVYDVVRERGWSLPGEHWSIFDRLRFRLLGAPSALRRIEQHSFRVTQFVAWTEDGRGMILRVSSSPLRDGSVKAPSLIVVSADGGNLVRLDDLPSVNDARA